MLILGASTSEKVQLVTSAAASIRAHVSYITTDGSTPPVVQNIDSDYIAAIASATTTDIKVGIASPVTKTRIGFMTFRNEHASTSCDCTVQLVDGTNTETLIKATLLAGESLIFTGTSWVHYGTNGEPYAQSNKLDAKLRVTSDVTFATAATFADVTGLTVALKSGRTYCFEAHLYHISNATTTGAQFGYNIGAAPTVSRIQALDTILGSATASTVASNVGDVTARDTAAIVETTGSATVAMCILSGYIQPSADGTFAIRATSEVTVASGLIVKAGSWLRIWETDS